MEVESSVLEIHPVACSHSKQAGQSNGLSYKSQRIGEATTCMIK